MTKRLFLILFVGFVSVSLYAQRWKLTRYEAIVGIGTCNYFGDIGGGASRNNWFGIKDAFSANGIKSTRPSVYLGLRYKLKQDVAVKLNIIYGMMSGSDKGSVNDSRGYSFTAHTIETSVQGEYSILQEDKKRYSFARFNRRGMLNNFSKKNLYVFAGIGGLTFFPKLDKEIDPSCETTSNSHFALVVPAGLGFKLIYSNSFAFGIEFGGRYVFSDYVDGFSTKYSDFNDVYYFGVINLTYRMKTTRQGYPVFLRRYFMRR